MALVLFLLFFLTSKEFLLFFDDSPLEPADDVDRPNNDHDDEKDNLYSFEVTDQLFYAGSKREAEAGKHANPNGTACQRQQRELQEAEVGQPPEYRARGSQSVYVLNDEHRQHSEPAHQLFDSRPGANEEVQASGSPAEARTDHVAERVADEAACRAYH